MDGLNSPAELVKAAKDAGQTALAITDHGTLSSHREMQIACKDQGIKPILGVEA
jgi:DNA polymerase III alpha subunit